MISFHDAKNKVYEHTREPLGAETCALLDAYGRILAQDIYAPIDLPPFSQSAVDGYAVNLEASTGCWEVKHEIKAGLSVSIVLSSGQACRIFTGAKIPQGTDAVIMQEHVTPRSPGFISYQGEIPRSNNIRPSGSDISRGTLASAKGIRLNAATIGFIAALGIPSVKAYKLPIVKIIITGNELTLPGKPLHAGKIYESNSALLLAALRSTGILHAEVILVEDEPEKTRIAVLEALQNSDLLILTGGVSVGKYDHVKMALESNGVEQVFWKVAQKPGKPLYFGRSDKKIIFGLPGNPAAALSCFYVYVYPAIKRLSGAYDHELRTEQLKLSKPVKKRGGLTTFLKGKKAGDEIIPLDGQESYILNSFAVADHLIVIPEEREEMHMGETVETLAIPS